MEGSNLILGRDDTYVIIPVKVDSAGNLQIDLNAGANLIGAVGIEGYYGGAWRKAPIPFGASQSYGLNWSNLSLPAGNSNQDSGSLTANTFTVFTTWAVRYIGTVTNVTLTLIRVDGGVTSRVLAYFSNLTSGAWYSWSGTLVCRATDILRVAVTNATLNDDLYAETNGYIYSLNL